MTIKMRILQLLILLIMITYINGFADWLASQYCDRPLVVGEIIMNQEVELSDERKVLVYRDDIELKSGDEYILGEKLTISITELKKSNQFMFETSTNAKFDGGGCDGIRSSKAKPTLILPNIMSADSDNKVTIVSGWAYGHETVYVSETFILNPPGTSDITNAKEAILSAEKKDEIKSVKANVPTKSKKLAGEKFKEIKYTKKIPSHPSRGQAPKSDPSLNTTSHIKRLHDEEIAIKSNELKKTRADLTEGIGNEDSNEPKVSKEKLTQILSKSNKDIANHWKKIKNDIKSSTGIKTSEEKKAAKKAKKEKKLRSKIRNKLRGGRTDHTTVVSFVEYTLAIAAISYIGYKIVKDRFKIFRYYLRLRGRNVDK